MSLPQSLTPATGGHASLSSPSTPGSMSSSSSSVFSSSGSGGRERERKPEGHQDASGGALPQLVACHPTPTALLPLILPAESPHPAPRKQIIMGRPGTGKKRGGGGMGDHFFVVWTSVLSDLESAEPHSLKCEEMCSLCLMHSGPVPLTFSISLGLQLCHQCFGYDSCTLYYCSLAFRWLFVCLFFSLCFCFQKVYKNFSTALGFAEDWYLLRNARISLLKCRLQHGKAIPLMWNILLAKKWKSHRWVKYRWSGCLCLFRSIFDPNFSSFWVTHAVFVVD